MASSQLGWAGSSSVSKKPLLLVQNWTQKQMERFALVRNSRLNKILEAPKLISFIFPSFFKLFACLKI